MDGTTVDGTTVDGTTVDGTIDGVMIVDAMIVGGTIVDAMIVGVGVIEKSVTVRRGILGAVTVIVEMGGVEMIVSEGTVKEIATEEIVMNVIVLVGGTNAQMIVTVIVMRGEGEGRILAVISGDETHHLHVLKVC